MFHAPLIHANGRTELVAVVTASPDRRAVVGNRYPDAVVFDTLDDLLATADRVDAVVVSTPNDSHVALAEAVVAAGLPVVIDKPVAPTAAAVRRLAEVADVAGVAVVPFHNRRWDADFLTLRALLDAGELGTVHRVEARWDRWRPHPDTGPDREWKRGAGAGILHDLGTHLIDQAVVLFGRPDSVTAEVATARAGGSNDDDVWIGLHFASGPPVHLWASAVAGDAGPRFRVHGALGSWVKYGLDPQEGALAAGRVPGTAGWGEEEPASWGRIVAGGASRPTPTVAGDYGRFYAALAACVLDGAPPPVPMTDAVCVAEVVDAAVRSSVTGRTVGLPPA